MGYHQLSIIVQFSLGASGGVTQRLRGPSPRVGDVASVKAEAVDRSQEGRRINGQLSRGLAFFESHGLVIRGSPGDTTG